MNTVFKAGYQAFLLLGLAAGCALPWAARLAAARALWPPWAAVAAVLLLLGARLPLRGQLRPHRRLRQRADAGRPEVAAVDARPATRARSTGCATNAPGDAVVLEAFGDDYSRVRPRPHLDLHRPPDRDRLGGPRAAVAARPRHARSADVQTLYTTTDDAPRGALIDRYGIRYVVVGPIEQTPTATPGSRSGTSSAAACLLEPGHDGVGAQGRLLDVEPLFIPPVGFQTLRCGDVAQTPSASGRAVVGSFEP